MKQAGSYRRNCFYCIAFEFWNVLKIALSPQYIKLNRNKTVLLTRKNQTEKNQQLHDWVVCWQFIDLVVFISIAVWMFEKYRHISDKTLIRVFNVKIYSSQCYLSSKWLSLYHYHTRSNDCAAYQIRSYITTDKGSQYSPAEWVRRKITIMCRLVIETIASSYELCYHSIRGSAMQCLGRLLK